MAHGADAVHELVVESGWSYPVTVRQLERNHPLENIPLDEQENSMMLSELLLAADAEKFENRADLARKLGPVCDLESAGRSSGVVARLKRTFLG